MEENAVPWLIVHRAGENRRRLKAALGSTADYVEIDVWADGGRVESRHDALLHRRVPFIVQRHRLPRLHVPGGWFGPWGRIWLDEVRAPDRLFLDIKDPSPGVVDRIVAALRQSGSLGGATASSLLWDQLDSLAEAGIRPFYTIAPSSQPGRDGGDGTNRSWEAYERRCAEGRGGDGESLHRRLATAERLAWLRSEGLRALCYTVNDFEEGVGLLEQGAGGLISDRLDLIARWRDRLERRRA